ncbi:N-acetylglucosamine kinase [Streptomyces pathocidini]|uniref:N-acetylglucosamine kinase n=1 Tax=Streptomyces pathocidini TaxID=1650571 RepID=A0ABW7URN9_9ACTN|nr:BadF/BadG/BcrA/BcrD ATPase family protein [Streptomyces pathocidini]
MTGPAPRSGDGRVGDGWVVGVDSGGSGLRVALARAGDARPVGTVRSREPVRTGAAGIDAEHLLAQLLPAVRELMSGAGLPHAASVSAAAIGAAGMATLGDDLRAVLPGVLATSLGVRRIALAADGVTAYAGALGQRPGAVVAAGTGMIALGATLASPDGAVAGAWKRADGWGHLLGDCGGGAWIGRAGLEAAMRAYDGRAGGSGALLARLEAVFGSAPELPGAVYPRTDRPAVLASFAPEVGRCAAAGDAVATGILREAARQIAVSAAAVCPSAEGSEVAATGGLFGMGEPLLRPLREELAERLPHARPVAPAGDPLDGALCIAAALATGGLVLPPDPRLLWLPETEASA